MNSNCFRLIHNTNKVFLFMFFFCFHLVQKACCRHSFEDSIKQGEKVTMLLVTYIHRLYCRPCANLTKNCRAYFTPMSLKPLGFYTFRVIVKPRCALVFVCRHSICWLQQSLQMLQLESEPLFVAVLLSASCNFMLKVPCCFYTTIILQVPDVSVTLSLSNRTSIQNSFSPK